MSFKHFTTIVDDLVACGVEEIGLFFMGESTLLNDLPEYHSYIKQTHSGVTTFLTTNGYDRFNVIPTLIDQGLNSLKVSLNGWNSGSFFNDCGVDCFERVLCNLFRYHHYIRKNHKHTELSCSSVFHDDQDQQRFVQWLKSKGINHYYLPQFKAGLTDGQRGNTGLLNSGVKPIPCWTLFNQGFIKANGDLSICSFGCDRKLIVGNVLEQGFSKAWNSPDFVNIRQQHLQGIVPQCCSECLR